MDGRQLVAVKPRLSGRIEVVDLPEGVMILKQVERAEYLAVSPEEWEFLQDFDGQKRVRDVLARRLGRGTGFNIRRFYDLLFRALEIGILEDPEGPSGAGIDRRRPAAVARWTPTWGYRTALISSLLIIAAGAASLATAPVALPVTLGGWALVLVLVSLELSLAGYLQGCVLAGCGRVVYDFRLRWDRIIPHMDIDARDAVMGGRRCEVAVALQAFAAPYLIALLGRFAASPEALTAAYLGVLVLAAPFGDAPAARLLHALFRRSCRAPRCSMAFLKRRLLRQLLRWKADAAEDAYLTVYAAYTLFWLGLMIRFGAQLLRRQGSVLVDRLIGGTPGETVAAGIILAAVVGFVLAPVGIQVWVLVHNVGAWVAGRLLRAERRILRRTRVGEHKSAVEETRAFLQSVLLFSRLPAETLNELARRVRHIRIHPGRTVIRQGDPGESLFIIREGNAVVIREDEYGERREVATLGPGDVFGEIALLEATPRTATVKARGSLEVYVLPRSDFERLVVEHLGAEEVRTLIQISAFLRRLPLFHDWPDRAILELAHAFQLIDVPSGEVVIRQGEENEHFYFVYEGRFEVRRDGRKIAELGPGDFFGEISLLENRPATADVAAAEPSRCLTMRKAQFLEMLAGDAATAYVIGSAAESRHEE